MSALDTMLTLRPLLLRRLFLTLFAGPILIAALATESLGFGECGIEGLCANFEAAWLDRPITQPA